MQPTAYIFALCSPTKKFPAHRDWYLKVIEEDRHQLADFHKSLMSALDIKFGRNRHFFNPHTKEPATEMAYIFHPDVLGAHWLINAIESLDKYGVVYIAKNGAMFPPVPDTFIEHSTRSLPDLVFPEKSPDEYIRIMQWANGTHFYLSSSINRVFPKPKYDTIDAAFNDALLYVEKDKIRFEGTVIDTA